MKNKLLLTVAVYTEKGLVRESNEDNFYLNGETFDSSKSDGYSLDAQYADGEGIFAVCDGMGGDKFGQKASLEVVNSFKDFVKTIDKFGNVEHYAKRINKFIADENDKIFKMAVHYPDLRGMGTTFASLIIKDQKAIAMNIGDSRVYHYRSGKLTQLTIDHTEAERMVRLGILSREEARNHIKRYILSRYIGLSPLEGKVEADSSEIIDIESGDIFIISSDGLNEIVDEKRIGEVLKSNSTSRTIGMALIDEAIQSGGKDNVTYMVVKVQAENDSVLAVLDAKPKKEEVVEKEDYLKKAGLMSVVEKVASREYSKFDVSDITFSKEGPNESKEAVIAKELLTNPRNMVSGTPYNNPNRAKSSETSNPKEMDYRKVGILIVGILGLALMSYVLTFLFGKLSAYSTRFNTEQPQLDFSANSADSKNNSDYKNAVSSSTRTSTSVVSVTPKVVPTTNPALAAQLSNNGGYSSGAATPTPTVTPSPKPSATNTPSPKPTKKPRPTNGAVSVTISPEGEPTVNEGVVGTGGASENASQAGSVDQSPIIDDETNPAAGKPKTSKVTDE